MEVTMTFPGDGYHLGAGEGDSGDRGSSRLRQRFRRLVVAAMAVAAVIVRGRRRPRGHAGHYLPDPARVLDMQHFPDRAATAFDVMCPAHC
jgi:hypothetical protein